MEKTPVSKSPEKDKFSDIREQVALDLAKYLEQYPNKNFAVRVLAKETGLNEKTIKRLINRENSPTYQTVFKLYSIFFDSENSDDVLEKCPAIIREYLKDFSPDLKIANHQREVQLLELLKKEPLYAEIFVLAGTAPLNVSAIGFRYGQYGVEILEKLEEENILIKTSKDTYTMSPKVPALDGETLKFLGEHFVHRFCRPRDTMSEHSIVFYAEALNSDGQKAWLEVDTEAFKKKLKIANDPKFRGNIPVFTFTATDLIGREKSK